MVINHMSNMGTFDECPLCWRDLLFHILMKSPIDAAKRKGLRGFCHFLEDLRCQRSFLWTGYPSQLSYVTNTALGYSLGGPCSMTSLLNACLTATASWASRSLERRHSFPNWSGVERSCFLVSFILAGRFARSHSRSLRYNRDALPSLYGPMTLPTLLVNSQQGLTTVVDTMYDLFACSVALSFPQS